jgi:hypothetical protein
MGQRERLSHQWECKYPVVFHSQNAGEETLYSRVGHALGSRIEEDA